MSATETPTVVVRTPRLASDITRSWVALLVFIPVSIVVALVAAVGMALAGVRQGGTTSAALTLIGWAAFCVCLIVATFATFARATSDELTRWLREGRPPERPVLHLLWAIAGGGAVSWAVTGSAVAIGAVVYLAVGARGAGQPAVIWSAVAVIVASWALMVTSYAVRLARENAVRGGAEFPGEAPRFGDWVYLAVQLSTTFSGSDVDFTTRRMRRVATGNSVIAFVFNTVIVALLVSVLISNLA